MVAMSGGVDSSVVAYLAKEQGYDVIGITMNVWPHDDTSEQQSDKNCCALGAVEDAKKVSGILGIPHYVLNYRDVFSRTVVEEFGREYLAGRTPNPCIRCNQWIKFGVLLTQAEALGAEKVATGHYAQVVKAPGSGRYSLRRGLDPTKDQSYALYPLTQWQLERAWLPLGGMTKERTREIAREIGLPVADKADSQDICFVDGGDYVSFVKSHFGAKDSPGDVVNTEGTVLGAHDGLFAYTVGQRKGLPVSRQSPSYVVAIDHDTNQLIIGDKEHLNTRQFSADDCNWIDVEKPVAGMATLAQTRYRGELYQVTLESVSDDGSSVSVSSKEDIQAIAPGQSVVFYEGDSVLGGGILS